MPTTTNIEAIFNAVANLPPEERGRFLAENAIDERTRRAVEELLAFDADGSTSLDFVIGRVAERALSRFEIKPSFCGPYRLGEVIDCGGMGTVHAAERVDGELAYRVAIKLLKPGADGPALRQRFIAERQILARLSHPNIARLLDAGHTANGQPYLVMEYIDGKPIDVFGADLNLRSRIKLFLKVCAAVSYLHRHLIVHRDLKPANILVTEKGEPKLLDFGIAKLIDLAIESSQPCTTILTPDYASPEQVTGGAITTATDVYSLGAVLYKILTGVAPHQFQSVSVGEIISVIANARITPPFKLAPSLKGDLEAVIIKALRKEAQERYASVDEFANDLRAWLEHRPVCALSNDVFYRTRRLLRHYWLPVAAATVVIASLSVGMYIANRERVIAARRFSQISQLSKRVIDAESSMNMVPGSAPVRKSLVAATLEYLQGLSRDAAWDVDLAQEISEGYWRMARIQGVNSEFNLGDQANATENLRRAEAFIKIVLDARPSDPGALFRGAVIANDRMMISDDERRPDVLDRARETVARIDAFLAHEDPVHPVRMDGFLRTGDARRASTREAAAIYVDVALAYISRNLYEEGARYARRAFELSKDAPAAQDVSGRSLSVLAITLRFRGDLDAALDAIHRARAIAERAAYASGTDRLFNLYSPLLREGRILGQKDTVNNPQLAAAIPVIEQALDIAEAAARRDQNDGISRIRVGWAARDLAGILVDRDPARALAVYDLGITRVSETGASLTARRQSADLLAESSYALRRLHRFSESMERIKSAFTVLRGTGDYPAERINLCGEAYIAVRALAEHQTDTGDVAAAVKTYEQLLRAVMLSEPSGTLNLGNAACLSPLYAAMARAQMAAGHTDVASELQRRRLDLWRDWYARLPNNTFIGRQLQSARHDIQIVNVRKRRDTR